MPKNKGRGGKKFRSNKRNDREVVNKRFPYKEPNQEYAKVDKMLGNCRCLCVLDGTNGEPKLCIIPGSFKRKRIWINPGDTVLINIRNFNEHAEADRADIVYKYDQKELRRLTREKQFKTLDVEVKEEIGIQIDHGNSDEEDEFSMYPPSDSRSSSPPLEDIDDAGDDVDIDDL